MTDKDIEAVTGVPARTFHRWRAGDIGIKGPQAATVYKFCDGLGMPRKEPATILGWALDADAKPELSTEPELPPEVRELLRRLRDPLVENREKEFILETLKSLIARRKPLIGAKQSRIVR